MKGKKLKNRIIISGDSGISKNNIPCEDYHLNIRQDIGDPTKVIFEYIPPKKYKRSVLKNDEDVKNFISFLEHQGEFLPGDCSKKSFIFKTLLSNLDETELEILRKTRQLESKENVRPKINIDTYFKSLNLYYENKEKYNEKYRLFKNKIMNNNVLTDDEKRQKIKNYKGQCLGCNQKVGMRFINQKGILKMECGNEFAPCNLYLEIQKPKIIFIPSEIKKLLQTLEYLKQDIIKIKLDYLFQLKNEEEVTKEFQKMKEQYNSLNKILKKLNQKLEEQEGREERRSKIKDEKIKLFEYKRLYTNGLKQYQADGNKSNLEESIETYLQDILPINKTIRDLLYTEVGIQNYPSSETGMMTHRLLQTKYTINQKELITKKHKIKTKKKTKI